MSQTTLTDFSAGHKSESESESDESEPPAWARELVSRVEANAEQISRIAEAQSTDVDAETDRDDVEDWGFYIQ